MYLCELCISCDEQLCKKFLTNCSFIVRMLYYDVLLFHIFCYCYCSVAIRQIIMLCHVLAMSVPPYWTPRGNRIHIIEKDCTTQQQCADKQLVFQTSCVRDWYLDWSCVECCTGDLCNYYVTVSPRTVALSVLFQWQLLIFRPQKFLKLCSVG